MSILACKYVFFREDQFSTAKHSKYSTETLQHLLQEKDNGYHKCRLNRKDWSSGKGMVLESDPDNPSYIELPTAIACGRAFDGDIVVIEVILLLLCLWMFSCLYIGFLY